VIFKGDTSRRAAAFNFDAGSITQRCLGVGGGGAIYVFQVRSTSQDGPALQSIIDRRRADGYSIWWRGMCCAENRPRLLRAGAAVYLQPGLLRRRAVLREKRRNGDGYAGGDRLEFRDPA